MVQKGMGRVEAHSYCTLILLLTNANWLYFPKKTNNSSQTFKASNFQCL